MRIVQGLRTFPEQDALYAQRPKVTNAKGGQSYHNYGLAIDFCLIIDGKQVSWNSTKDSDNDHVADWEEVIRIFEAAGWKSGRAWLHGFDGRRAVSKTSLADCLVGL